MLFYSKFYSLLISHLYAFFRHSCDMRSRYVSFILFEVLDSSVKWRLFFAQSTLLMAHFCLKGWFIHNQRNITLLPFDIYFESSGTLLICILIYKGGNSLRKSQLCLLQSVLIWRSPSVLLFLFLKVKSKLMHDWLRDHTFHSRNNCGHF